MSQTPRHLPRSRGWQCCRSLQRGKILAGKENDCRSPRRGANSIPNFKEIEIWETDAIFCNPMY
jgi:hypothetical protein